MSAAERDVENLPETAQAILETSPLLPSTKPATSHSWWQASPGKLVPYVLLASIARGLTLSPRVDVFTHLACSVVRHEQKTVFDPDAPWTLASTLVSIAPYLQPPIFFERNPLPHSGPSHFCLTDPKVQAAAANLQTVLNTTIGILSALTSGYWGSLGDRLGRKWIAWLVVFGFMSQDLVFMFCALYGTQLHLRQYTLIVGSIAEGLLGSWATFYATINAYISDCSSPGSKAKKFARYYGLFYAGVSLGPAIGSSVLKLTGLPTLGLFYIATAVNCLVLIYIVTLLPESRTKAAREAAVAAKQAVSERPQVQVSKSRSSKPDQGGVLSGTFRFMKPLYLLGPRRNALGEGNVKASAWDLDLTFLAIASFCGFLLNGMAPNKYMYAEHLFEWDAAQLGYYISIIASCRAIWLIVALPILIKFFKPNAQLPNSEGTGTEELSPAQRRALLMPAISFDLRIARLSVFVDIMSFVLTCLASTSTAFIAMSTLGSFGGGMLPANQSIMLSLMGDVGNGGEVTVGKMLGAISMVQALGQNIMGPLLFGFIYASTVATLPQAIFIAGAVLLTIALISLLFVAPHHKIPPHLRAKSKSGTSVASHSTSTTPRTYNRPRRKRGRSRTAKDLRRPSPSFDSSEVSSFFDGRSSSSSTRFEYEVRTST